MIELGSTPVVDNYPLLDTAHEQLASVRERPLSTAELAECTCPEFCERDHDTD
jgi:hypothetical protein